jgi:hypothetical protein
MAKKAATESESLRTHDIYAFLLSQLELTPEHRTALNNRGFSDDDIKRLGYRTFPTARKNIAERVARKFEEDLTGVPGFWRNEKGEWELAGKAGIAIPVRDAQGRMVAVKLRVDKPSSPSSKYLLLSSNPKPNAKTGEVRYPHGTSAPIRVHWPLGKPKKVKILRITEGELKADACWTVLPEYTISLPGVTSWRLALDVVKELRPEKVLIAFDSDKTRATPVDESTDSSYRTSAKGRPVALPATEEDYVVGKSLAGLYFCLCEAGFDTAIEDWPAAAGKGIDDVVMAGATDQISKLEGDAARVLATELLAADVPEDWVYVVGVKRFYHTKTLVELDKEMFADRFAHEDKGNPATVALKNPAFPKVDFPVYLPKQPVFFERDGKKYFNTWRPSELEPVSGDVTVFIKHCEYIVPDPAERRTLLDWLAYCVQFPGEKIMWALLLQGVQGTGKSFFGSLMRVLLGPHNVSFPSNDMIHEMFTAWQKSCQLVIIEELMARGRLELMNKLKPMITQEMTMVREMHKPAYEQPNVFNFLMFTNHEDAVILDATDRRYCVIFSPAEPKDTEYYEILWHWLSRNAGKVLHFFQSRDLSGFKAKGHAPMTAAKKELIANSLPALEVWMHECIVNNAWPFMGDLVATTHLCECLPRHVAGSSLQSIGKALQKVGAQQVGQVKLKDESSVRLWSVRRHEVWASAKPATLAAEYERWGAKAQPGGNPMLEAKPL